MLAAALVLVASALWTIASTLGYSRVLAARARGRAVRPVAPRPSPAPSVTAIIATREPADVLAVRVSNLFASDWPADRLRVIIGVDAAAAPALVPALQAQFAGEPRVHIVAGDVPGKASALNAAVSASTADVLVFTDSHQSFDPPLLGRLVDAVGAPGVGAATGILSTPQDDGFSASYWKAEQAIRGWQSANHSVICVTGAVYAMPRARFTPIPPGTICDDLFATMSLVSAGWRVVLVPEAIALDARRFTNAQQYTRRVRTMTGLLQLVRTHPRWLRPSVNPIWFDLWMHKLNRVLLPWVVLAGGVAGVVLALAVLRLLPVGVQRDVLLGVSAVGLAGVLLLGRSTGLRERLAGAARAFLVPVEALANALRGRWNVWTAIPQPPSSSR